MKLLTYPYDVTYNPSMPVVEIQLHAPGYEPLTQTFPALIDSGADGTLIPIDLLEAAGARYVGKARLHGITGAHIPVNVYLLNLRVGPHWVYAVRVAALPEEADIILGRSTLNHLSVTLNGPASMTEILA